MEDLKDLTCRGCRDTMELIADIPPVGGLMGMRTYQCMKCGATESFDCVSPNISRSMGAGDHRG